MLFVITRGALTTAHDDDSDNDDDNDDDVSGSGVWRRVTEPRKAHACERMSAASSGLRGRNLQRILIGQFVVTHADSPAWPADTTNPSL